MISADTNFLQEIGVAYPIIQAPMGGATTPELVAAVCNSGAVGSLAGAYLTPDQISADIKRIRTLTDKPFNVNLFAGGFGASSRIDARPMLSILDDIHRTLGLAPASLPDAPSDPFDHQLEVILDSRPAIFSFTFGIPSKDAMARLKARGIAILGTATTAEESIRLEQSGVTGIVAQGAEAGAHRGTFLGSFEESMFPTMELVGAVCVCTSTPVVASGGLMDGRDIARTFASGAVAAQLGTAFLTCPESGISQAYKDAILSARTDTTVITRAFSGRPARGLSNDFVRRLQGQEEIILSYPLQNILTRPMRNAAAKLGKSEFQSLWAGQGVTRARTMPAGQLVRQIVQEMKEVGVVAP